MSTQKNDTSYTGLEIAVIGMAGRFPGSENNLNLFWENLKNGVESISFFSNEELIQSGIETDLLNNPNYIKAKGVVSDSAYFDASFFNYSSVDAKYMDPQIRVFHECVWEALENAGYDPYTYKGLIGLFAGASNNLGWEALTTLSSSNDDSAFLFNLLQLNDKDYLNTRISYKLNLRGPSMMIQTACSTSLVAINAACRELLTGGCDIALAGGVSLTVPQKNGYIYQEGMIMSPDGHCRAFDAEANGTVGGEGAGIVALKRLEDALEDGDTVLAVIKGSATNNDGFEKVGYTAPSVEGQSQAIKKAYYMAEVDPESISYIETHGTGTPLGDPIEIGALKKAFNSSRQNFCAIGAIKTNIGHLSTAAGVAGFIKTVLSLRHRQIPPSLHFNTPNPKIDFGNSPFYVNRTLQDWVGNGQPLRAGVSSFGIGGTNAHVVLEEAPKQEPSELGRQWNLLLLSAKTSTALDKQSKNLVDYLIENPDTNLSDMSYTLQVGRAEFKYRRMVLISDTNQAIDLLSKFGTSDFIEGDEKNVVFMFPGQGSQYTGMGLELYQKEATFREEMDRCFEILQPMLPFNVKAALYPEDNMSGVKITDTLVTQPLIFAFEYALAKMLMKWGVKPEVLIGHSIGEYAAACLAGVFSLEDALSVVVLRGRLMQELPEGAMISVPLSEEELAPLLTEELSLAAVNSSSLCIVSGSHEAIEGLGKRLEGIGCQGVKLPTSRAFHSKTMEPVIKSFTDKLKQIKLNKPKLPYISNVTGKWITVQDATSPEYWGRHLSGTVRFADGLTELLKNEKNVFIEVGPGWTLNTSLKQHSDYNPCQLAVNLIRYSQEKVEDQPFQRLISNMIEQSQEEVTDQAFLLKQLGRLWCSGVKMNWGKFYEGEKRYRIPLPTYPFERQRYWIDGNLSTVLNNSLKPENDALVKKATMEKWFYLPSWKRVQLVTPYVKKSNSRCLLFVNNHPLTARLAERLMNEVSETISVEIGTAFAKLSSNRYSVNPGQEDNYSLLLEALDASNQIPEIIIHLWNITDINQFQIDEKTIRDSQSLGFYSLLHLAQVLGAKYISQDVEIIVVTNNMHKITGEEITNPAKGMLLGPCMVIPQEYGNIMCRSVDLIEPLPGIGWEKELVEQIISELLTKDGERFVAYRNNIRWVKTFERIKESVWVQEPEEVPRALKLKKQGVYLITGGLGKIGLLIAKFLAEAYHAKIILIGRSEFPSKETWEEWLAAHSPDDPTSQRIGKLKEIEGFGVEIQVYAVDLSDPEEVERIVEQSEKALGKINGVIHAAGVTYGNLISGLEKNECENHFQAKVFGLLALNKVFRDRELDFCILMSSLAAVLGGLGYAAYSAANIFMDNFVECLEKAEGWVSVNWGGWDIDNEDVSAWLFGGELKGLAMEPSEGLEALKRILTLLPLKQVVVSTADLDESLKKWVQSAKTKNATELQIEQTHVYYPRPALSTPYASPESEIEEKLATIWQEVLGIERVGVNDNFFDLGGDSLKAVRVSSLLRKHHVKLDELLKYQTISQLCKHVKTISQAVDFADQEHTVLGSDKNDNILDIKPIHKPWLSCFEDAIISVLKWLGRGYEIAFAKSWYLEFAPDSGESTNIGKRLSRETEIEKALILEKYYGVNILYCPCQNIDSTIEAINQELEAGRPVIIGVDSYWIPWDVWFQNIHSSHAVLVVGIDREKKQLYCTDPHYLKEGCVLPFQYLQNGGMAYVTFEIKQEYGSDISWREIITSAVTEALNPTAFENMFDGIRALADSIEGSLDVSKETAGYSDFWEIPLNQRMREIAYGRYKFGRLLEYLAIDFKISALYKLSGNFKVMGVKWDGIRAMMFKLLMSYSGVSIKEIALKIREAADYEQSTAFELLELCRQTNRETEGDCIECQRQADGPKAKDMVLVELSPYFNHNIFHCTASGKYSENIPNGFYFVWDEDCLTHVWQMEEMKFFFPAPVDNQNDNLSCMEQTIQVSEGNYCSIVVLGNGEWGSNSGEMTLCFADGETEKIIIECEDWNRDSSGDEVIIWKGKGIEKKESGIQPCNFTPRIFAKQYYIRTKGILESLQFPYNPCIHIYAITLGK